MWVDRIFETPDNVTKCILPYNNITKNLFYNQRLIISVDLLQPLAWRVSKVEPFVSRGNILYTLKQDVVDEHHDYIERDEDGNIIGYWADMFSETNTPNNIPKKPEPELSGDYAEITYAGAEPHIKVKGSYKTITITYYNSNVALSNQTPGTWSYFIDGEDASSLVTTLSQSDPNKIKVKFMGDEEYLGKVLVIRNTRDDVVAELQLAIVAI